MKILYLDPAVHTPASAQYKYYDGVVDELAKLCEVFLYRSLVIDLNVLLQKMPRPDVVIFGLGWFNHKYFEKIKNLDIPSICWLFKPQNNIEEKLNFCKINNINTIITPIPHYEDYERKTGIPTKLYTYGFDPTVFFDRKSKKKYDVGFSGALHENKHYPKGAFKTENIRTQIGDILKNQSDIVSFWNSSDDKPARIASYEEYAKTINSSKVWIATQAAFGDITPRFFEVMGSGTALLCEKVPKSYEQVFIDGINCIQFDSDLSDFSEKLDYFLKNPKKLNAIALQGHQHVHENYSWATKAEELMDICRGLL